MTLPVDLMLQAHELVAARVGLDIPPERLGDLESAIASASTAMALTCEAYLARLRALPAESTEWRRLAGAITVGETYFFRDTAVFDALEHSVFPELIAERRSHRMLRLRVWSAGCATGEEPYSLAILLDRLLSDRDQWSLTILGTDLNPSAIEIAQRGFYRDWAMRAIPQDVRDRYFHRRGGGFQLDAEIRRMVAFAPLNLAEPNYPDLATNTTAMDLILCRNVIMYFTRQAQREVVERLRRALTTGGWLALSPAESSAELLWPLNLIAFPSAILSRKQQTSVVPSVTPPLEVAKEAHPIVENATTLEERAMQMIPAPSPPAAAEDGDSLVRARAFADAGRLEEARQLCQSLIASHRLDTSAHVLLAAIHQELGEIGPAMRALRAAIYLSPESPAAHFLLGVLQWRQGQRRRGRRSLETAVQLLGRPQSDGQLPEAGGLTAGRLREIALTYLEER